MIKHFSLFLLISLILISTIIPEISLAQLQDDEEYHLDIWALLDKATNWFFGIVLFIAVIMLVYAGFTYITAGGNETKTATANKILIFALIGVAVSLLARGLPEVIQNFLTGSSSSSPTSSQISPQNVSNTNEIENQLEELKNTAPNLNAVLDQCNCNLGNGPLEEYCLSNLGICKIRCCGGGGGQGSLYLGFT